MQIRFQLKLNIFAEETEVEVKVDRKEKIASFHSNSPNCFLLTLAVFQNHYFLESQRDLDFPFPWFSSTFCFLLYALTETEKKCLPSSYIISRHVGFDFPKRSGSQMYFFARGGLGSVRKLAHWLFLK